MSACNCVTICGDDGDSEGPGVCKVLPMPRREPLVEVVLVRRDDRRFTSATGDSGAVPMSEPVGALAASEKEIPGGEHGSP